MNTELYGLAFSATLAGHVADSGMAPVAIAWSAGLDPLRLEEIVTGVGPGADAGELIALIANLHVDPREFYDEALAFAEEMEALAP